MAGAESDGQFQFTGIKKYFNSYTLTGRMNVMCPGHIRRHCFVGLILQVKAQKNPSCESNINGF
ncbi:ATP synthase membrane subunit K, mitochondrial [Apodemus speciosus]|uniref:ATP synthase membrane subunit K, mitochondrial n=1 Tax=Apodemus speciosus TaxID=105296 RepID=A0ABQ0FTE4_APOSI